jgi:hypothetical protein
MLTGIDDSEAGKPIQELERFIIINYYLYFITLPMKHILLTTLLGLYFVAADARNLPDATANNSPSGAGATLLSEHKQLSFVENIGLVTDQNHDPRTDIQFSVAPSRGLSIFVGCGAIHYQFSKEDGLELSDFSVPHFKETSFTMCRMDVELVGANRNARLVRCDKQNYYENHFTSGGAGRGSKADAWSKIIYQDI